MWARTDELRPQIIYQYMYYYKWLSDLFSVRGQLESFLCVLFWWKSGLLLCQRVGLSASKFWWIYYRTMGNFHWCKFSYHFKLCIRIKFRNFPGTHVGLIQTFLTRVACFFHHQGNGTVCGYHIYGDIWSPVIDERLPCEKESGNLVLLGKIFRRL